MFFSNLFIIDGIQFKKTSVLSGTKIMVGRTLIPPKATGAARATLRLDQGTSNFPPPADADTDPIPPAWWPPAEAEMKDDKKAIDELFKCYEQNGGKEAASVDPTVCTTEKRKVMDADERLMRATTPKP